MASTNTGTGTLDSTELSKKGTEEYKKGNFEEALRLYDTTVSLIPHNVTIRANSAAALIKLDRFHEALKECQEVLKLDPGDTINHQRMGYLFSRFGHVEDAKNHFDLSGQTATPEDLSRWEAIYIQMSLCVNGRKSGDWKKVLTDCNKAIAAGADHCPDIFTCRAEALVKLHQLDEAVVALSRVPKQPNLSSAPVRRFGMLSEAYKLLVKAQIHLAFGRFDQAITTADSAEKVDRHSADIVTFLTTARLIFKARNLGNDLYASERFTEAKLAYSVGLQLDPSIAVLYNNNAACSYKLRQWETSIEDSSRALKFQPKYLKALMCRAASNCQLGKWVDAVKDYEILHKEMPEDTIIATALSKAQMMRSHTGEIIEERTEDTPTSDRALMPRSTRAGGQSRTHEEHQNNSPMDGPTLPLTTRDLHVPDTAPRPPYFVLCWKLLDVLVMLGLLYTLTGVPFHLAFNGFASCPHWLRTVDFCVNVFFLLNALLRVFYYTWMERRLKIFFCTCRFVYEAAHMVTVYVNRHHSLNLQLTTFSLKLLRLTHLWAVRAYYPRQERHLLFFTVEVLRVVAVVLGLIHVGGCVFFFLSFYADDPAKTWIGSVVGKDYRDRGMSFCYLRSIYWSTATVTTTGYGDYHAQTGVETIFSTFFMLVCCGWWNDVRSLFTAWLRTLPPLETTDDT